MHTPRLHDVHNRTHGICARAHQPYALYVSNARASSKFTRSVARTAPQRRTTDCDRFGRGVDSLRYTASSPKEADRKSCRSCLLQGLRKKTRHRSAKVEGSVANLLENILGGRHPLKCPHGAQLFSQGDLASSMYFIKTGKVKVTVASAHNKKAVLALLGPRDFFGEGCLVSSMSRRTSTATTLEPSRIFRIGTRAMLRAFHSEPQFAATFLTAVLARNVNQEEDLCDHIFNHSEKRLARVLLKLSRFGTHDQLPDVTVPKINQETLAEIVGTTRSRVNFFMTKFRKLGLIRYERNKQIVIMAEALTNSILRD